MIWLYGIRRHFPLWVPRRIRGWVTHQEIFGPDDDFKFKPIPRLRLWLNRYGGGFIWKPKSSPHNTLMVILRLHEWAYQTKRWGRTITVREKGYPRGTRMIVLGLGKNRCISIHITPNTERVQE